MSIHCSMLGFEPTTLRSPPKTTSPGLQPKVYIFTFELFSITKVVIKNIASAIILQLIVKK